MEQPLPTGAPPRTAPSFYLTGRQPVRPGAIVLALAIGIGGIYAVAFGLGHSKKAHLKSDDSRAARSVSATPAGAPPADEKDDPNQVDTIVLGDAADAPVPARPGDRGRPSNVHATILIRLPRYGDKVGLIPDTPAGHLLYQWLAAFNQASYPALANVLPNDASASTAAAQMELRQRTGGVNLLSAKEVQPGVLVFRLRDQTPEGVEALGTLQVRQGSNPAAIASFSLRAVAPAHQNAESGAIPSSTTSPR